MDNRIPKYQPVKRIEIVLILIHALLGLCMGLAFNQTMNEKAKTAQVTGP